eukprot:1158368-Pelagomonas_calceolata.AAC.9
MPAVLLLDVPFMTWSTSWAVLAYEDQHGPIFALPESGRFYGLGGERDHLGHLQGKPILLTKSYYYLRLHN